MHTAGLGIAAHHAPAHARTTSSAYHAADTIHRPTVRAQGFAHAGGAPHTLATSAECTWLIVAASDYCTAPPCCTRAVAATLSHLQHHRHALHPACDVHGRARRSAQMHTARPHARVCKLGTSARQCACVCRALRRVVQVAHSARASAHPADLRQTLAYAPCVHRRSGVETLGRRYIVSSMTG